MKYNKETKSWSEKFDLEILKQQDLFKKIELFQKSNSCEPSQLIYDSTIKYDYIFFRRKICSKKYPEGDKIKFLKQSIDDNNFDYLNYQYSFVSKIFLEEKELALFLFEYYRQEDINDQENPFRHLEFSTKNLLPQSKELIDNYLCKRDAYKTKYYYETLLPVTLFNLGFKTEALDLLEFFVIEQEKGNITQIIEAHYREKSNPFILIGLLGDHELASRANILAFRYFKNITLAYTFELGYYLKYINPSEYKNCLKYWLTKYPELGLTEQSNINDYTSLIVSAAKFFAEEMGMEYWKLFVKSKDLWKKAYEFESASIYVAETVMSPILTEADKKEIIDFVLDNNTYLRLDNDYTDSGTFQQYIKIILKTKKGITEKEMEAYVPSKYKKNSDLNYILKDVDNLQNEPDLENIISDLVAAKLIDDFEIDPYIRFQNYLCQFTLDEYLNLTQRVIGFDAEGGMFPLDYKQLFDDCFSPIFETSGFSQFCFIESKEMQETGCKYKLGFQLNNCAYETSFIEEGDFYNVSRMSLIINGCLIDNNSSLRLISINTGDQTALFGIFNPDIFIPIMIKYNVGCWAGNGDTLVEDSYC